VRWAAAAAAMLHMLDLNENDNLPNPCQI